MNVNQVVRTITIKGVSEGVEKLTGDVNKLAAAQENVAVVSEQSARRTLSIADAWRKQTLALDEAARSSARAASATKVAEGALREGLISTQQYADRLDLIAQKYGVVTVAAEKFARAQSLATVNTASAINQRLGVKDDFGTAVRANDIAAYGKQLDDVRAKYNPLFAAGRQYKETLAEINAAAKVGAISEKERTAAVDSTKSAFVQQVNTLRGVKQETESATKVIGLNRYEILNLSRQLQDVGVSLAGGQSPFVVLTQQGSQILDVFQATNGSVRGFFSQAAGWAARLVTSTAGVTAGIVGIGAAALYMGQSFASAQKDIDRALSGIGAGSGLTRGGINRIADRAASSTGLSVSEAREAATAFAATGRIVGDNVERATLLTKDFARAMGVDASEATKTLAKDLSGDLVGAALKWNATLGFADGKTIDYIQSLTSMGQRQEAINALISSAAPAIGRAAENTSKWALAWDFVANKASNAADAVAKAAARGIERGTGANLGGFDDQERLANLRQNRAARAGGQFALGIDAPTIRALDREIAQLEQRIADLAKQGERVRFAQMSLEARDFARSVNESTAQIERLQQGLSVIEQIQARRVAGGGGADPGLEQAAQVARVQLALALEQEQVEIRKAQVFAQNALAYQNVSATTAQTLAQMQQQLGVAQAVTDAAQIEAQHRATTNALLAQGKTLVDAIAIADAQRAISIAQANAEADRQLKTLQQQGQLLQASSDFDRDRIAAAQTYRNLLEKNVDSDKARAVAAQQLRNADISRQAQETADAEREAASETERRARAANAAANEEARAAEILDRIVAAAREKARIDAFVPSGIPYSELYTRKDGGKSQFNPEGYTFTIGSAIRPPDYSSQINQSLSRGGSTWDALASLIAGGVGKPQGPGSTGQFGSGGVWFGSGAQLDTDKLAAIDRLIATMPKEQQISATQKLLDELNQRPASLEREEHIVRLTQSLEQLRNATDANTQATQAITDVLSPFYSSDPRRTNLGFRAFAGGGIMSPWGEIPINRYAGGGVATSPQVSVFGEGSTPEAYVPVPSGRIPVEMRMPANNNQPSQVISVENHFHGPVTKETADMMKRTGFQNAQQMKRILG